ncbi:CG10182, partial [Drosophila busckii]
MVSIKYLAVVLLLSGLTVALVQSADTELDLSPEGYKRMLQLRHLAVEFFDYYTNFTTNDVILTEGGAGDARLPTAQDRQCLAEMIAFSAALKSGSMWALRMIDSWGRLPSGLLYGNFRDMGNFDECLRIKYEMPGKGALRGKYCTARFPIKQINSRLKIRTAVCFPASCSGAHMEKLLRQLLQRLLNIELNTNTTLINDEKCQTAEKKPLDGLTIFTIVLLSVLAGIMLLCTLYDYFCCQDQQHLPAFVKICSVRANSRALFRITDSKSNPNIIECLHGMRCMSLIWVVYGHDYSMAAIGPNINLLDIPLWIKNSYSMLLVHAPFSVDTFFFLSGMLVLMVALRAMEKAKGKLNVPLMYLHRYLRLTPPVAMAILVYMKLLPLLGNGPLYNASVAAAVDPCKKYWYYTLLYVQNYATEQQCIPQTWYLAVDTQMYVISPLLLFVVYKWRRRGIAVVVLLMLLLSACLFSTMVINNYTMFYYQNAQQIYNSTHTHATPWLVGFIFGYLMHELRGKTIKLSRPMVWLGWLLCLALIFTCIFATYPYYAGPKKLPILNEAFYLTFTRIGWPLALGWVVFACNYGYGGMANSFLSSPLWQPLSKLSYSVYVWHIMMQMLNIGLTRAGTYFSDYQVMLRFWYDFGFSVILAYFMYVLVEAPFGGLQNLLLPSRKSSPPAPVAPAKVEDEQPTPAAQLKQQLSLEPEA